MLKHHRDGVIQLETVARFHIDLADKAVRQHEGIVEEEPEEQAGGLDNPRLCLQHKSWQRDLPAFMGDDWLDSGVWEPFQERNGRMAPE